MPCVNMHCTFEGYKNGVVRKRGGATRRKMKGKKKEGKERKEREEKKRERDR